MEQRLKDAKMSYLVQLKAVLRVDSYEVFKAAISTSVKEKRAAAQTEALKKAAEEAVAKTKAEAVVQAKAAADVGLMGRLFG
jgi:high-affinity K+ transport system ATPase subunit B